MSFQGLSRLVPLVYATALAAVSFSAPELSAHSGLSPRQRPTKRPEPPARERVERERENRENKSSEGMRSDLGTSRITSREGWATGEATAEHKRLDNQQLMVDYLPSEAGFFSGKTTWQREVRYWPAEFGPLTTRSNATQVRTIERQVIERLRDNGQLRQARSIEMRSGGSGDGGFLNSFVSQAKFGEINGGKLLKQVKESFNEGEFVGSVLEGPITLSQIGIAGREPSSYWTVVNLRELFMKGSTAVVNTVVREILATPVDYWGKGQGMFENRAGRDAVVIRSITLRAGEKLHVWTGIIAEKPNRDPIAARQRGEGEGAESAASREQAVRQMLERTGRRPWEGQVTQFYTAGRPVRERIEEWTPTGSSHRQWSEGWASTPAGVSLHSTTKTSSK